jgi:urea transport system permease protein
LRRFAPSPAARERVGVRVFFRLVLATVVLVTALLLAPTVHAQGGDDPFTPLATTNFDDLSRAVERLAASGHPQARATIEALNANRLFFRPADRAIFIRDGSAVRAAVTGAVAADVPSAGLTQIRVNNRVRRAMEAAMGSLALLDADPRARQEAANRVFRARDPEAIPALDVALARETVPAIRRAMELARAAAVIASVRPDEDKIAAIAVVKARGDLDARGLLASITGASPAVTEAAAKAIEEIDTWLAIWQVVQNLYYGLSLGSVLLLAAIGLAVTFGVMGVINMAHGEMVMLGAYTTFVVQDVIRTSYPHLFDFSLFIALPLAFLVAGTAGAIIERTVIRFLYGRPLETLLATFGLSLIIQQAVRVIFGANNREVGNPSWMSGAFDAGGLLITWNRLWIIVFAAMVVIGLLVLLQRTSFGLKIRAVTQNRRMAASMGIRTPWVDMMTFALGSGIAGLAGVALSQIENVSPNLGQSYIIDSFMVVVFGGVGNLWGTLVAALALGVANKLLEPVAGAVLGKIIVLVLLVLFIQRKPRGLFPLKGRAAEA